jgi:hypothetical protein
VSCCFCGFKPKSKAALVAMADGRHRCKSGDACMRRLRAGKDLKGPVRLALETAAALDDDTRQAIANIREAERVAREIQRALYIHGLCITCGTRPHSPGRPRCEQCHRKRNAPSP